MKIESLQKKKKNYSLASGQRDINLIFKKKEMQYKKMYNNYKLDGGIASTKFSLITPKKFKMLELSLQSKELYN